MHGLRVWALALLMASVGSGDALAGASPCWKILGLVTLTLFLPPDTPMKHHLTYPPATRSAFVSRPIEFQVRQMNGDPGRFSIFDSGWLHHQVAAQIKSVLLKEQPSLKEEQGWTARGWQVKIDRFLLEKNADGEFLLAHCGPLLRHYFYGRDYPRSAFLRRASYGLFRFTKIYPEMGTATVNVLAAARYDGESRAFLLNKLDGSVEVENSLLYQSDDFSVGPWIAVPLEQTTANLPIRTN
jgi:hypothetical protein